MTAVTTIDANDMINVTKRLTQIMQIEFEMIKGMKLTKLHTLYDEKMKLASILEDYKATIANNPHIIKDIPKDEMAQMKSAVKQFEEMIDRDGKEIIKAKKVHQIIMNSIKSALVKRAESSVGYNKQGELDKNKKKVFHVPPISISESY